jgi:hypothetical protein
MTTSRRNVFLAVGVLSGLVGGGLGWRDALATTAGATPSPAPAVEVPALTASEGGPTEASPGLQLQLHLASVIEGCHVLLPPNAQGTTRFSAHVLVEPVLGAVVDAVEVLDDTIGEASFTGCVVAATLGAELGGAGAGAVDEVRFRYSAGAPADNAREFLESHPSLVEQHPQLAAIRDRAFDAARSDDDATAFATVLASDAAALGAFEQWSAAQGLDLSGVTPGS